MQKPIFKFNPQFRFWTYHVHESAKATALLHKNCIPVIAIWIFICRPIYYRVDALCLRTTAHNVCSAASVFKFFFKTCCLRLRPIQFPFCIFITYGSVDTTVIYIWSLLLYLLYFISSHLILSIYFYIQIFSVSNLKGKLTQSFFLTYHAFDP